MTAASVPDLPDWVKVGATAYIAMYDPLSVRRTTIARITATQVVTDTGARFSRTRSLRRIGDSSFMADYLWSGEEPLIAPRVAELLRKEDAQKASASAAGWADYPHRLDALRKVVAFADKYRHLLDDKGSAL